uniref:Uncharacterized protein n=1 Tax=Citrus limon TaxID=2708 RepID=A0A1S8AD16_CITLI
MSHGKSQTVMAATHSTRQGNMRPAQKDLL